jgi:eukaryotic translation initiation factor 2C
MIEDMESMFEDLLERFKRVNKTLPRRIVFYRDGVSEGEFSQVDQVEIPRMAAVVTRKYGTDQGKWPWLCFIVVGKKHHQRFFPRDEEGRDRNGNENLYPGYVVDVGKWFCWKGRTLGG